MILLCLYGLKVIKVSDIPDSFARPLSLSIDLVRVGDYAPIMINLRDFLSARRSELEAKLAELESEMLPLRRELDEISSAQVALALMPGAEPPKPQFRSLLAVAPNRESKPPIRPGSIKAMVISVLGDRPDGATANEILVLMNNRFGAACSRPSLSPQLSRLKDDGWVNLTGKVWILTDKEETPDVGASGVSESGGVSAPPNESGRCQRHPR
jgi:hypothetical protein